MNYIRKVSSAFGGIFLAALLLAAFAPKATHGLVAALVEIANTPSNPVPTTDSLGTATTLSTLCIVAPNTPNAGNYTGDTCYTVPQGQRAVIEQLDGNCGTPNGTTINSASVNINGMAHWVALVFNGLDPFGNFEYNFSVPVHYYADPGTEFSANLTTTDTSQHSVCFVNLTGRLVPKP